MFNLAGSTVAPSSVRNSMKVAELLATMILGWTVPSVTFIAAISETVPWRTYSNSRSSGRPRRNAAVARLRLLACMAVFVRHEALHYRMEVEGLHRWAVAAAG